MRPMTHLAAYKRQHPGLSDAIIGRAIGFGRTYVNKLVNGRALPSLETAVLLDALTDGAVPPSSWITLKGKLVPLHELIDKNGGARAKGRKRRRGGGR